MVARTARLIALCTLWALAAPGCYSPPEPECGFACGAGGACPDDYSCASDNICHRNGTPSSLTCDTRGVAFDVQAVMAVDAHTVAVTFTAAPDPATATRTAPYTIQGLTVMGPVTLSGSTVTFHTAAQTMATYTLTVTGVTRASDGAQLTTAVGTFTGIPPFDISQATSIGGNAIEVIFDAPPDPTQAVDATSYAVPGLTVTGAPTLSGNTVTIPTSAQDVKVYTLTVSGVQRASDFEPLDTASAMFVGDPPFDVTGAMATSHTSVSVTFDAPPDPGSATTLANYSADGGLAFSGTPVVSGDTVMLTTSPQTGAQTYTITVSNVTRNADGAQLMTNTATFTGRSEFDVAGATSTGNGVIQVTFSDAPDPTAAMTLANYAVDGGLVLSGTPTLSMLTPDTVIIDTSSQAATTYTVTVSNVTRASDGEPLTMTSAMFAGMACPAIAIMDDGTQASGGQDLVISKIQPFDGGYYELYNTTNADIDLGSSPYTLAVPGYPVLYMPAVTIKAHGHLRLAWPAATYWPDETAGGELVLYKTMTTIPANIVDFVCWDTDSLATSAKADAQSVGKWSTATPACATAITSSPAELARKDNVTGTLGTDYDSAATVPPLTCP